MRIGRDGGSMRRSSQFDLSKTLGRILRYEIEKYSLTPDESGWVQLHELIQKCGITHSREEVVEVARNSAGSQGRRFDLDEPAKGFFRIKARYVHGKGGKSRGFNEPFGSQAGSRQGKASSCMPEPARSRTYTDLGADAREWQSSTDQTPGISGASGSSTSRTETEDQLRFRKERQAETPPVGDSQDSSLGPESFDISTPRCTESQWERYQDPTTNRVWFFNSEKDEFFFEDSAADRGWCRYDSDVGPWWHNERNETWFMEGASN